ALVRLAHQESYGWIFSKIAPNNYQYPHGTLRECERDGVKYLLDISDYMEYCVYYGIEIEPRENLYRLIKNGSSIVDVGVNFGETLLNFAKRNPDGTNIGFEPVFNLYEKAKRNIDLNKFANVVLVNKALSDDHAILDFVVPNEFNSGGNYLTSVLNGDSTRKVTAVPL